MAKKLRLFIRLFIGIILVFLLVKRYLSEDVQLSSIEINSNLLFAGLFVIILSFLFSISKLHVVIAQYVKSISETTKMFFIGWFFSNFLPTNVAGDVYIIVTLKGRVKSISKATALVTIQRIIPVLLILLYAVGYSLFRPGLFLRIISLSPEIDKGRILLIFSLLILCTGVFITLFRSRLKKWFDSTRDFIFNFVRSIGDISWKIYLKLVLLSLIFQTARLSGLYVVLLGLNQDLNIAALFFVMIMVTLVSMIPLSIGALGIQESGIVYGLHLLGVPIHIGIVVAFLYRGIFFLFSISGGLLFLFSKQNKADLYQLDK